MMIIDAHCDTLSVLEKQKRTLGENSPVGHVDLPRLAKAGVNVQFFALCTEDCVHWATIKALQMIDSFYQEVKANSQHIEVIVRAHDVENIVKQDKIAALLTLEGGEPLAGEVALLRMFYRLGVRAITLTWNQRNQLADGVAEQGTQGGLTRAGMAVVKEMNRLGMVVDVAHLAEQGFKDVLSQSVKPVVVSHANCRALCEHPRNLQDWQIKACAETNGVIGLCYYPDFIHAQEPSLDRLLDHAVHMASVAGVECVGLGSDFDGIEKVTPGLEDVTKVPQLMQGLADRGFHKNEIAAIMGGNWLRLLKTVLA